MSIVGRTYLERGDPVVVVVQWRTGDGSRPVRNVLVRRATGQLVVRPFRGLRTVPRVPVVGTTRLPVGRHRDAGRASGSPVAREGCFGCQ